MGFNCGIVGLPNVGKSTLFNALTATQAAQAANFPFCTIEPNIGRVAIPDARLDQLAALAHSAKILPNQLEFVDIAGLVRGASQGEGLGNQFLANIREVDAISMVARCFALGDITHVEGSIDAVRDCEIIETELMLADMESVERRLQTGAKKARGGDKAAMVEMELLERAKALLDEGKPVRLMKISADEQRAFRNLQLITAKPVLYIANVGEDEAATGNDQAAALKAYADQHNSPMVIISAKIEAEVALLESQAERAEFLESLGLEQTGLTKIVKAGFDLLAQLTFFTVGPKEARAWNVARGAKAPQAAGVIHTDFERGFICAETIGCDDYLTLGSEQAAKEAGKIRLEGRDYIVKDGDVFHFRFNV
ncbi:MAG: redox-regulated ATPase YchF [Alphaproteobacteria bacterium]